MEELDPHTGKEDLARRLARYRRRVAAEGRPRSVRTIDRAIEAAGSDGAEPTAPRSGKLLKGRS